MEIIERNIEDLIPYGNNPRYNDEAVEYVENSIREFGFKNPIIIDRDNVIIAGHTRLKAAQKLGLKKVPTIMADDLTDEQVQAFRIADNSTGAIAKWDFSKLEEELNDLEMDFDMSDFGLEMETDGTGGGYSQNINPGAEIDIDDYSDDSFKHECPKCGFRFN